MKKSTKRRIVLMSPKLMELYQVAKTPSQEEYQPITFCDPQDCLDMLIARADGEEAEVTVAPEDKSIKIEKQWGELELRLSFFTDAHNWQ